MGVIYKATCLDNNKTYIGQTRRDFDKRRKEHERATDNYPFHAALRKHGIDNFNWEIVEECPDEDLDEREAYWINYYHSYIGVKDSYGYNATLGGDNASALDTWREGHRDQVREQAMKGLEFAQKYNQEHWQEHFAQLAEARKAAVQACSRKVCCVDLNLIFNSLSEAERWSQTTENPNGRVCMHQHISKVCNGKRKTAGGYQWKYI